MTSPNLSDKLGPHRALSLRAPLDLLFLFCCVLLTADVLVPEIFGHGKTKDYGLWYWAGQQVLQGQPLYPGQANAYFYGYTHLLQLREHVEIVAGKSFNLKALNDFILAQGLLPPEQLADAVEKQFLPAGGAKSTP